MSCPVFKIGEKWNLHSQGYCQLQYPTDVEEYMAVECSRLALSYSLKDDHKIVSDTNIK